MPESYVAPAKQYWFSQQNNALRSDIYHAKLMDIISELRALSNSINSLLVELKRIECQLTKDNSSKSNFEQSRLMALLFVY